MNVDFEELGAVNVDFEELGDVSDDFEELDDVSDDFEDVLSVWCEGCHSPVETCACRR